VHVADGALAGATHDEIAETPLPAQAQLTSVELIVGVEGVADLERSTRQGRRSGTVDCGAVLNAEALLQLDMSRPDEQVKAAVFIPAL
jgi:hypothetical protein